MDQYIEVIKETIPCLEIKRHAFHHEGQNNDIVIINGEFVFKFPKYPTGVEKLKRETEILRLISGYVNLDVPRPIFLNLQTTQIGQVYYGYRMIHGVSFRKEIYDNMQQKRIIAQQLAGFLKQLHSVPYEKVQGIKGIVTDNHRNWEKMFEKIKEKLFPFIKIESQKMICGNFNRFLCQSLCLST